MENSDFLTFSQEWVEAHELYGRAPSDGSIKLAFRALEHLTLDNVRGGLQAHLRDPERGKYAPRPADILAQVDKVNPNRWPSPDEAWAMVPWHEADTGLMCDEMARALELARPLLNVGDKVAARRAFIDGYQRELDAAKVAGREPVWWVSPGRDPEKREAVILQAYRAGRLSESTVEKHLPHLSAEEVATGRAEPAGTAPLLEQAKREAPNKAVAREALDRMRSILGPSSGGGEV